MLILDKACFLFDLRTGSEYIGWVGAVVTVLNLMIDIYNFTKPHLIHSHIMFDIIVSLVQYLISVCLIKGAKNKRPIFLVPWLIGTVVNLVLTNLLYFVFAIASPELAPFYILALLVVDMIGAYLWLIVYTFYRGLDVVDPGDEQTTVIIENDGTTSV